MKEPHFAVCLTVRFPEDVAKKEGITPEVLEKEFADLKKEMKETSPEGVEFELTVSRVGPVRKLPKS